MLVAGIDVGSLTAKAVILENGKIKASAVVRATPKPDDSARLALGAALEQGKLKEADIAFRAGTGYGRKKIRSADAIFSEIACHAKGALTDRPTARSIIDIGGQDAKAAIFDENGQVLRYQYNDKCASGTGRFLEIMAEVMGVKLDDMGGLALAAENTVRISNQCVVFAETEVISLINAGQEPGAIIKGIHQAMAGRVAALARSIGVSPEIVFTGGVAKNKGVAAALAESLGVELFGLSIDPQINGAFGAALMGAEQAKSGKMAS
ncbi:MAG: acyl-CoA dehydratase activase [Desulfatibacillaceae bacterium]|nr:acyl-CoA dehydratase activase [Desulfatibacillaceae bacterium]